MTFQLRQQDGKLAIDLPKRFQLSLFMGTTYSGCVMAMSKEMHELAEWIKENVPQQPANTRNRDKDMMALEHAFFESIDTSLCGSLLLRRKLSPVHVLNVIGYKTSNDNDDESREAVEYASGLLYDLPSWLRSRYLPSSRLDES